MAWHSRNGCAGRARGQLALEALLSLSVLLAALCTIAFFARGASAALHDAALIASERHAASGAALALDTAADSMAGAGFSFNASRFVPQGGRLLSRIRPKVSEPLFHNVSSGEGGLYVQSHDIRPG